MKYLISSLCLLLALTACVKQPVKYQATFEKIAVASWADSLPDTGYEQVLAPYKQSLDEQMGSTIGEAAQTLSAYTPESPLSNWAADALRDAATAFIGQPADIGVVNMGGLRCDIPQGPITLRRMFELMPFDNQLAIVWLKGSDIVDLCQGFARYGGQGVSGLTFYIEGESATHVQIDGKAIVPEQEYSISTNDYLVAGNDDMMPFTRHTKRIDTGMTVRDAFINAVKKATKKGKAIDASIEGRVIVQEAQKKAA